MMNYLNRQFIVVTFIGNRIPLNIKINLVNLPDEPLVQPVQLQCKQYENKQIMASENISFNEAEAIVNIHMSK